jgi:hypothetical protein
MASPENKITEFKTVFQDCYERITGPLNGREFRPARRVSTQPIALRILLFFIEIAITRETGVHAKLTGESSWRNNSPVVL